MESQPKVCIDRILPRDLFRHERVVRRGGSARAIVEFRKLWMNGSTLRVRFVGGTPAQQTIARTQALWWTEHANLRFDFGTAPEAEIRVSFDPAKGAWSYIGTDARSIPLDQPTMNLGFLDGGTAAHEFGHAIGLAHEHQNPSGGIEWNEPQVIKDLSGSPNFWNEAKIRHNVLRKYSADQIRGTKFDPDSIMLYFFPAAWTKNGVATHANHVLSAMDKAFVASAMAYPRTSLGVAAAVVLRANAQTRTPASIGKPGEEDLFKFSAASGGRYVIDTRGPTDVIMRLFGPDSHTDLVAEDDDSGIDTNARIAADIIPGEYFVQVRHFNRAGGTGSYSVRVRKLA